MCGLLKRTDVMR